MSKKAPVPYKEVLDKDWAQAVSAYGWVEHPGQYELRGPCHHCGDDIILSIPIVIGLTVQDIEETVSQKCECKIDHKPEKGKGCGRYGDIRFRDNITPASE